MIPAPNQPTFEVLEARLRVLLPESYQDRYEEIQPVSMGSAGLKYGDDGRVAWDEIWGSFCDLAMAGGPPHRGTLLQPGSKAEIDADPQRHRHVVEEVSRGIELVSGLHAEASPMPGWVRVTGAGWSMAGWLLRAIAMENISVQRREGASFDLPVGPAYRVEKEIKNIVTAVAKTCHYWRSHMADTQRRLVTQLLDDLEKDSPLLQPDVFEPTRDLGEHERICFSMTEAVRQRTGILGFNPTYSGWLGLEVRDVRCAVWMMRLLVASNLLARREGTVIFVPVRRTPDAEVVVERVSNVHQLAVLQGLA